MEQQKIDILSLSKDELTAEIVSMGEKTFRAKQIYDWLHVKKVSDFSQMSNICLCGLGNWMVMRNNNITCLP